MSALRRMERKFVFGFAAGTILWLGFFCVPRAAISDGGIRYHEVVGQPGSTITYERVESPRNAILDAIKEQPVFNFFADLPRIPFKPRGAPGVAIFDYDGDGDLDLYASNGPGAHSGLFSNQLLETGQLGFVDVSATSGASAFDQDSNGVCFGDVDNDGDHDLMVLGATEPNRLFENRGDGTFGDITGQAGVGGATRSSSSCAMGDVNGDGLLDIFVANTHTDWTTNEAIVSAFTSNEHNQLFLNSGGNVFSDVSGTSGIEVLESFPPEFAGAASLTWAVAMVDYDLDGDVDIVMADDQGGVPFPNEGGLNYGVIHLLQNDGAGRFTDVVVEAGLDRPGSWMGLSFGDFNCDGVMDFFATNVGDFPPSRPAGFPVLIGRLTSRWFLGREDGTFADPGVGDLVGTPFGWGTSAFDYDNDGDTDVVYHGDLDAGPFISAHNPGVYLQNQGCSARFVYDDQALSESTFHSRRNVQGLAAGDLNHDGFVDVVTVSNFTVPEDVPLEPNPIPGVETPFDATVFVVNTFDLTDDPFEFVYNGTELANGNLSIEVSDGGSGNGWIEVTLYGTVGLTERGRVNRDGIGAVVALRTPEREHAALRPVLGGSSYASQDSLRVNFGLGTQPYGDLAVLWPGGVRNRLRHVRSGERLVFPEIPCDFEDQFVDETAYATCVGQSLDELVAAGVLDEAGRERFFQSAFACQDSATALCLKDERFRVEVGWRDFADRIGEGKGTRITDAAGLFYFFNPDSIELHANVFDGCAITGHYWVFAAASTNVEYTLWVTDTVTGAVKSYFNPLGAAAEAVTDTRAFACR